MKAVRCSGLDNTLLEPLARDTSTNSAHARHHAQRAESAVALERHRQRRLAARPYRHRSRQCPVPARPGARDDHVRRPYGRLPTAICSRCRPATPARRFGLRSARSISTASRLTAGASTRNSLGRTSGTAGDQRRPADFSPRQGFQRARQSDAQRQCGGRPAFGLRHSDQVRRRRQLVAGRTA